MTNLQIIVEQPAISTRKSLELLQNCTVEFKDHPEGFFRSNPELTSFRLKKCNQSSIKGW
jgi:hypothetical protein